MCKGNGSEFVTDYFFLHKFNENLHLEFSLKSKQHITFWYCNDFGEPDGVFSK